MIKVAYLTTNLSSDNGWGRYSLEIIKRMPHYGIEPVVLTMPVSRTAPLAPVATHAYLRSFSDGLLKPLRIAFDWFNARAVTRPCTIIHCLAEPLMPVADMLAGSRKIFIANAVGTYAVSVLKTRWASLYQKAYQHTTAVFSISHYTAAQVTHNLPQIKNKIKVIPLGVDTGSFVGPFPDRQNREHAFLMVGQVKPRKGTLQAVHAMAMVMKQYPDAKLYIAGSVTNTGYVQAVREQIAAYRIDSNVIWLEWVSNEQLHEYYKRVRGLVMPSINAGDSFEGFGLVHLEANACGVPAIGSLDCGNEDAVRDGFSGFLIEQGNIQALADAMMRLLNPQFDWNLMSKNALQFAREMSWERVVEAYVSVYTERNKQ
jgi:glycosyltransferase involved in cell wall biosynthesis